MKAIFYIFSIFLLLPNIGGSQEALNRAGFKDANNNLKTQNIFVKVKPYKSNLEDSPLLFVNDRKGYVIPKSGEHTETLLMNYNILLESTLFRKDGEQFSIDSRYLDSLIILEDGNQAIYCYKNIKGESKIKLMEVLSSGNFPLYSNIEASLVKPDYNPVLMTGSQNFTINTKKQYYVEDGGHLIILPNKAKKIISSPEFSKEFKKVVKTENPRLRKENDIISFFNSIN